MTMRKTVFATCFLAGIACLPARADQASQQPVTVPFKMLITRHIVVMIKINGKGPYRVIFDTGAPLNLINTKTAKASGLVGKDTSGPLFGLFGPPPTAKMKTLQIGDLKVDHVPVMVIDHPTVEIVSKILGPVEGIIGFPFFARYKMTLDYQAKEMTFVPNDFQPTDIMESLMASLMADEPVKKILAPAGLWGIVVEKKDEEAGVVIKEVLPKSAAAEAGLKAGDRLLTLDDRWTDTLADCYSAAGYVKPGTTVEVMIRREGKELSVKVTPRAGL
jgi:hypothetical protein